MPRCNEAAHITGIVTSLGDGVMIFTHILCTDYRLHTQRDLEAGAGWKLRRMKSPPGEMKH